MEDYKKKYEEAFERARVWKEKSGMPIDRQGILDDIFPELKESEEENIRKNLRDFLLDAPSQDIVSHYLDLEETLNWLEKQGEKKPAWSEEDEELLTDAIKYLEIFDAQGIHGNRAVPSINWLKSLKERYSWKPSKEQLHYLSWIANIKLGNSVVEQEVSKHLNELLEDLKKLKGE